MNSKCAVLTTPQGPNLLQICLSSKSMDFELLSKKKKTNTANIIVNNIPAS